MSATTHRFLRKLWIVRGEQFRPKKRLFNSSIYCICLRETNKKTVKKICPVGASKVQFLMWYFNFCVLSLGARLLKPSLFTLPKLEKVDFEKYSLNNPDYQVNVSKR